MSSDFENIMNGSWDEIPEKKLLPKGSWLLEVRSASGKESTEEGKSDQVIFVYTAKEPMDDVDAEALAELGSDYDFSANRLFVRFNVEDKADWDNVRKHIEKHGVSTKGMSVPDAFKALRKKQVVAYLTQESYVNKAGEEITDNRAQQFTPIGD